MKKLLNFLFSIIVALVVFTSCENQGEARAIIGHSYQLYIDVSNWETIYFSPSGTAQLTSCIQGTTSTYTHLTYKVQKCNIEVYYDYSSYWNESARGELLGAFTYMPEQDYLIGSNNGVYNKIN